MSTARLTTKATGPAPAVRYIRNFSLGRSTHIVELYAGYTREAWLIGEPVYHRESTRIAECIRGLQATPAQLEKLKRLARERNDGIVLADGEYRRY